MNRLRVFWTKLYLFTAVPVTTPAVTIALLFEKHSAGWSWVAVPQVFILGLAVRACVKHGRVRLAIHVLLWGALLLLSMQCVLVNGIRTPAILGYPVLLMMTGWWLGRRAAYTMLAITLAWLTAISLLNDVFWRVPMVRDTGIYWVTAAVVCGLATKLAMHVAESSRLKHAAERRVADELTRRLEQLQEARATSWRRCSTSTRSRSVCRASRMADTAMPILHGRAYPAGRAAR